MVSNTDISNFREIVCAAPVGPLAFVRRARLLGRAAIR
jgi:hypothetical protein